MKRIMIGIWFLMIVLVGCGNVGDLKFKNPGGVPESTAAFLLSDLTPTNIVFTAGSTTPKFINFSFKAWGVHDRQDVTTKVYKSGQAVMELSTYGWLPIAGKHDVVVENPLYISPRSLVSGDTGTFGIQMFMTGPTETSNVLTGTWSAQ